MALWKKSRSQKRVENNLGIIAVPYNSTPEYRSPQLNKIDKYMKSSQYDGKMDWNEAVCSDEVIASHQRKPKVIYPFAKILCEKLSAKLFGKNVFPKVSIEEDPDTTELMELIEKNYFIKAKLLEMSENFIGFGSAFIRFKFADGKLVLNSYNPKVCYPEFSKSNDLEKIEIRYVYDDPNEQDHRGNPKRKWFRLELGKNADISYDNPEFTPNVEPVFNEVGRADHGFGFVQGEWFSVGGDEHNLDGNGLITNELMGFIDSFNYNLSKSDSAVDYGLDPQLILNGMDDDELDGLIKSSTKGWNLGREGDASLLEAGGSGIDTAKTFRDDVKTDIHDISRIALLDPEKIVGSAQSAKAMEVLNGPTIELVNKLRPYAEKGTVSLYQKILVSFVMLNKQGFDLGITMPSGYRPISLNLSASWPEIFPLTTQDKQQIISMVIQMTSGNIISRETGLKYIMAQIPDIPIEDMELELQKVNTQQQFNTWGGF